jgi:hypothetical protein
VLGLANVFGQRPSTAQADSAAATISVYAATAVRGGDFMEGCPDPPDDHGLPLAMDLVLRAVVIFAFVLLLTRIIGKRELGSLQPFDLILLIVLGDALQQGLTQDDYSLTGAVLVVGTIAVL